MRPDEIVDIQEIKEAREDEDELDKRIDVSEGKRTSTGGKRDGMKSLLQNTQSIQQ